jgi:hypothetical protein
MRSITVDRDTLFYYALFDIVDYIDAFKENGGENSHELWLIRNVAMDAIIHGSVALYRVELKDGHREDYRLVLDHKGPSMKSLFDYVAK